MRTIFQIAMKDIKLMTRDKMGMFFILGFPILMGVFFGLIAGSFGSGSSKMSIAVIDEDGSEMSRRFIEELRGSSDKLNIVTDVEKADAQNRVKKGRLTGVLVLPKAFGERAGIFWGEPATVLLGMDPSRTAEAGMMQGFVMQSIGKLIGVRFQDPSQFRPAIQKAIGDVESLDNPLLKSFLGSVDSMFDSMDKLQNDETEIDEANGPNFKFADIQALDLEPDLDPNSPRALTKKLVSRWDISFPQAMMWGVLGCVAGFAISLVRERTLGTMLRLESAPISLGNILMGKALACFLSVLVVLVVLTILGVLLGMRPKSYPHLAIAGLCIAVCFVGVMMAMSVIGKTEQAVSGAGWGANMLMAMFGGCMIPVIFMPDFMHWPSRLSPVKWAIDGLEGAIWREFSFGEMLIPCMILIAFGAAGLIFGVVVLRRNR